MSASHAVPVTAIVLAHNEERNLPACLESMTAWVEELFVVDSGSTDSTVAIARAWGARVVEHPFEHYGAQRNWALASLPITTPWVLNLDADERVTPELRAAIQEATTRSDGSIAGYLVARRTVFMGRWIRHGGHYPVWHLRLFRSGRGRCEDRQYDQHFFVDGRVEKLRGDLIDVFTSDVTTFIRRHLRWAQLEAQEQSTGGEGRIAGRLLGGSPIERRRWFREVYGRLPLFVRPALYFVYRYIIRLGFLDGAEGLVFHLLQAFWYRFLVDAIMYERRLMDRNS
ncbi:MAG: glycosyltransferase family 2 protein [Candidatus Rokuibacteriota bacterium]|nr:MAG: glycosyltransferase family 2 protein [Candidatus Rokubacteria bacterium]PYO53031.1 MAG: glycosyltransferase family 2 protein [Candidatus Rokubacteria bacterium]